MKRLIIIAMMLAAFTSQAQLQLNAGLESKAVSADVLEKGTMVGRYDDNSVWLTAIRHGWRLMALDRDLQVVQAAEMEINADKLLAATMNGNTATMILLTQEKKNTRVMVAHLSLEGESSVDTLADYNMPGRKDQCLVWGATSQLGNYMAVVTVRLYADSAEYIPTAYLVAPRGNVVYKHEFAMTSIDQIFVTDNGRIVTLATDNTEAGVEIMVNYVTANITDTSRNSIPCDPLRDIKIVNVVGNRMVAIATTSGRGRKGDNACNGMMAMSFDLDSAKVHKCTSQRFTTEDINVLYNRYLRKGVKSMVAENVSILGCVPTSYGGAMAITRSFEEQTTTNDGIYHHLFQHMGIHVVGANTEGELAWVSNIRCHDMQENNGNKLYLGINGDGKNVYIYKTENPKDSYTYDINRAAKVQKTGKKGNLVRYAILPNGFVEKAVLERKTKHNFLLVTANQEIITVRGRKLRRATVSGTQAE